jgi:hypothetical protein
MEGLIRQSGIDKGAAGNPADTDVEELKVAKSNLENTVWYLGKELKDEKEC